MLRWIQLPTFAPKLWPFHPLFVMQVSLVKCRPILSPGPPPFRSGIPVLPAVLVGSPDVRGGSKVPRFSCRGRPLWWVVEETVMESSDIIPFGVLFFQQLSQLPW